MLTNSRRTRMALQVASTVKINVCSIRGGDAKGKRMFGKHWYEV
jgi:sRNA-binding carbon storage regulator CsrA